MSDQVAKSVEENKKEAEAAVKVGQHRDQGTVLRERGPDEPPNPKKRMWEENVEAEKYEEQRRRDEL